MSFLDGIEAWAEAQINQRIGGLAGALMTYILQVEIKYEGQADKGAQKKAEVIALAEKSLHDLLPDIGDKALDATQLDEAAIGWLIDKLVEVLNRFFARWRPGSSS